METPDLGIPLKNKSWRVYYFTAIFIVSSLIQWILLVNFKFLDFLLNSWLLFGAYLTFLFIMTVFLALDCTDKTLPDPLQWIFRILIVEIFVIGLSNTIANANNFVLYYSLAAILICMMLILAIGKKINLNYLPILVLIVFNLNVLLIILSMTLMIIAKFFAHHYTVAFLIVTAFAFPILIINTLSISLLIHNNRYDIGSLTDCIKAAQYIYVLFAAFIWFTLSSAVAISDIM